MMSTTFALWARRNLFASAYDTILSIIALPVTLLALLGLGYWIFFSARWSVIVPNLRFLMIGQIPANQIWRTWLAVAMLSALSGATLGQFFRTARPRTTGSVAIALGLMAVVLAGAGISAWAAIAGCAAFGAAAWTIAACIGGLGRGLGLAWLIGLGGVWAILAPAGTNHWGGLLLSVIVTTISTLLSLPLGILLALGRRSRLVSIRSVCSWYIELIRSIPLISVIYWAWIIVPLVLPPQLYVANLVRGIAGFVLFYAAFVAEYVRAGLQGVDEGQQEAADALGLSVYDRNIHILLPQALRTVIPALVGNVLDLFNNVPLVFIIGLTDFLQAGETVLANPKYGDEQFEVYVFIFAIYLAVGIFISYAARRLESSLRQGRV